MAQYYEAHESIPIFDASFFLIASELHLLLQV